MFSLFNENIYHTINPPSAVQISYILATGDPTADPSSSSNFGDKILRVLHIGLEMGDQWNKLAIEESLGDSPTFLARANKLGLLELGLELLVTTAAAHKRDRCKRPGLNTKGATRTPL
jgi:hypothetical protein